VFYRKQPQFKKCVLGGNIAESGEKRKGAKNRGLAFLSREEMGLAYFGRGGSAKEG